MLDGIAGIEQASTFLVSIEHFARPIHSTSSRLYSDLIKNAPGEGLKLNCYIIDKIFSDLIFYH